MQDLSEQVVSNRFTQPSVLAERRYKILRVDPRLIIQLLNWFRAPFQPDDVLAIPVTDEIPEFTEVVSVIEDWKADCINLMISHPSFERVPPGCSPPYIHGILTELRNIPLKQVYARVAQKKPS